jgi:hypothetical protein
LTEAEARAAAAETKLAALAAKVEAPTRGQCSFCGLALVPPPPLI